MDPTRRHLIVSLALLRALPASRPATAASRPPLMLEASEGGAPPGPPLRYGTGPIGPILRMTRGLAERIVLRNGMTTATSLDLQGLRISPPLGRAGPLGGAVPPGTSADILVVPDDAGTFWYHPWTLDPHVDQTGLGLAGALIVDDPDPPAVDADLVAVLSDHLPTPAGSPTGPLSIDGNAFPRSDRLQPGSRVRLRLVNASTRQVVAATLSGAQPLVVAIDGQPSEPFKPRGDTVPLGPGSRADLMFDVPRAAGADVALGIRGADAMLRTALSIRTTGEPRAATLGPIAALPPNPRLPRAIALEQATRATLVVEAKEKKKTGEPSLWAVNGVVGIDLPKKPLFTVEHGRPVVLAFTNRSRQLVAFRLHGFSMRLLHDLDDGWEPYWCDSVLVPPDKTHHAAFLANLPGRWLIESPFFAQAAGGLRTWFEVS